MLGFVITVGMSHGSLDWLLARQWGLRSNGLASCYFLLGYVTIVLVSLGLWWLVPSVALGVFLLMSMIHFGQDWQAEMTYLPRFVIGVATVSVPAIVFQQDVESLFLLLVPHTQALIAARLLSVVGLGALAWTGSIALQRLKHSPSLCLEILTLLLSGLLLPPLIYFSLYFCMLHTTKHWSRLQVLGVYKQKKEALWSAIWPTALCLLAGVWVCYESSAWSFSNAFIRTVFIGLAALTVPHWLLLEVYPALWRKQSRGYG
jgi:Brp/Blh family beta-carotene 15,15'-monooxygenase